MKDFLQFRTMIAPVVIQIAFWLAVVVCILFGIAGLVSSLSMGDYLSALGSLLIIVLGPIGIRVYAELLIVLFRILDALKK